MTSASNAREAISIICEGDGFDLFLTDIVLPGGMTGPQLAEKAVVRVPNLKVLFLSGYSEDAIIQKGRLDTAVHLLQKPFRRKDLAREFRKLLGNPNASS